jgi:hypothetical protein
MKETLLKRARTTIAMVVTLLSLTLPSHLLAYDFEVDGIYYEMVGGNSCAVICETVDVATSTYVGSVEIPEKVNYNGTDYVVTTIAQDAFQSCTGLTSVVIPNSVTVIGVRAFKGCTGLTSVTIPNSVTTIWDFAFYGCTDLTEVTIPSSVTEVGRFAFQNCVGLSKVNVENLESWCKINFSHGVDNPLAYAHHLYVNDKEVTNLEMPESITTIGKYTFYNCYGLTEVTIPNSVTEIGSYAFWRCSDCA